VRESIAARVDQTRHPLLQQRPGAATGPTLVLAITSDRGLCGSFNQNVVKAVGAFIREHPGRPISLGLVGRKGRDLLYRRGLPIRFQYVNMPKVIGISDAEAIAEPAIADFTEGKVDSVYIVYNEFKSVIQQQLRVARLLPLAAVETQGAPASASEYIYEPSPQEIFDAMLPRVVEVQILHAMLESTAGFYAAQMTAMDAATRNSAEMIDNLTLTMNKVRQAQITREIIEVVSGAEAL
jgi:F-type H+-transporting ATPase subunit gamma